MKVREIQYVRESEWKTNKKNQTFSNLNSRHVVLMEKIKEFYNNKQNLEILTSVINGGSFLSLRVIDFFVTNYSKEKEIIYEVVSDKGRNEKFMVYYSYKSQLKAYSKKQFDPFCRRERILFFINKYDGVKNDPLRTTVGQLNFFRWAIKNNILDYIYENYDNIENEMNNISKNSKKVTKKTAVKLKKPVKSPENPKTPGKKKTSANDLTLSATKKVNKHNITITVKFN